MKYGLVVLALLAASPARAGGAEQAVGLFMQACLRFAGDPAGLRKWTADAGLHALPSIGQRAFLQQQPGIAFDATNGVEKFVLVSGDDGSCSTVAQHAETADLLADLGRALEQAGIGFTYTDRNDPQETALHHREYQARKGRRSWRLVVSTGGPQAAAHPMLTAIAE